jgi:4-hydroxybenzoate polyprenyltransferase
VRTLFALIGVLCWLAGMGSCSFAGASGVFGAAAGALVGLAFFALGLVALGFAAIIESVQDINATLKEGFKHFAKHLGPPKAG